jgi:protein PhnA
MNLKESLSTRSANACELCGQSYEILHAYLVPNKTDDWDEYYVVLCQQCLDEVQKSTFDNPDYFHFLTGSIWSEVPAVKVLSFKILSKLQQSTWAQDTLEIASLTPEELRWANAEQDALDSIVIHKDAYGTILQHGDTIFLTENLPVKGTSIVASKGTKVSKIRLVHENAEQIEGKIEGMVIVILTKFVRKAV